MTTQFNEFIGQPLEVLKQHAAANGFTVRVTAKNGNAYVVTMDYVITRINVSVDSNDIVTGIRSLG